MSSDIQNEATPESKVFAKKQAADLPPGLDNRQLAEEKQSNPSFSASMDDRGYANQLYGAINVVQNGSPLNARELARDEKGQGKDVPLMKENAVSTNATEVVKDAKGQSKEIPLDKLSAGDHTIKLKNGREFIVHVPDNDGTKPLPVMFVFSGSAHGIYDIEKFVPESGINRFADSSENKFIAVYPLPKKHFLGIGSNELAYAWNVLDPKGGLLIDRKDSRKAGYDDLKFVQNIVSILPQIANVDQTHKDWAAIGFSHGGVFLNYLASNIPNLFPTMGLVGSAVQNNYKYDVKQGNAENVAIVNLRADEQTLPFKARVSTRYRLESFLHSILPKHRFQKLNDLAAINNLRSDPGKQMSLYENRLGPHSTETINFNTPVDSNTKDKETLHKSTDPGNHRQLAVFDLPTSQHSYPEKDPSGARTNGGPKYTEFETDQQIVNLWMKYNNSLKPDSGHK